MSIKINQYQDVFAINNNKVLVDYFFGKIEILDFCSEKGQVIECHSESYDMDEKIYFKRINEERNKNEYTIVIVPSYSCNMECEYCYEGHEKKVSQYISPKELKRNGVIQIYFMRIFIQLLIAEIIKRKSIFLKEKYLN